MHLRFSQDVVLIVQPVPDVVFLQQIKERNRKDGNLIFNRSSVLRACK